MLSRYLTYFSKIQNSSAKTAIKNLLYFFLRNVTGVKPDFCVALDPENIDLLFRKFMCSDTSAFSLYDEKYL